MFKFQVIPISKLPKKKPRDLKPKESLTLEDKFHLKKREIYLRERRRLRRFHFITIIHDEKLVVMNGFGEIFAELENPLTLKTQRKAREIYTEELIRSEKQEGGCYFN